MGSLLGKKIVFVFRGKLRVRCNLLGHQWKSVKGNLNIYVNKEELDVNINQYFGIYRIQSGTRQML